MIFLSAHNLRLALVAICFLPWLALAKPVVPEVANPNLVEDVEQAIDQAMLQLEQNAQLIKPHNLKQLQQQVETLATSQPIQALLLLRKNKNLLLAKGNSGETQALIHTALSLQDGAFARALMADFSADADDYALARTRFELAGYLAANLRWSDVLQQLQDKEIFDRLPLEQAPEAQLLVGTALQKLKKHRQAIAVYEKIKPGTSAYRLVLLNMATAYLRQDWWTDAQLALEKSLALNAGSPTDLDYRMHTVLGFAQLQFGFYRDARSSFRQVGLDNQYTSRALFGLGLAALNQKDYAGALNAFSRLRAIAKPDISVAESYLLYAFTLRQMQQLDAALSAYQEAVGYYQGLLAAAADSSRQFLRADYGQDPLLISLNKKQQILAALINTNTQANISNTQLQSLQAVVNQALSRRRAQLFAAEQADVESYLSQSKFGLASLYDQK